MLSALFIISCGGKSNTTFQNNDANGATGSEPFSMLDEYPAIQEGFTSLDEYTFNELLGGVLYDNVQEVGEPPEWILITADYNTIVKITDMLPEVRSVLGSLMNQNDLDWPADTYDYETDLYAMIDTLSESDLGISNELISLLRKVIGYIYDVHGNEIETVMTDLIAFLQDNQGQNIGTELPLLQEALGKLLIKTNSTFAYNSKNTYLGNATRGMDVLLSALKDIIKNDPEARDAVYDVLHELGGVLTATTNGKSFAQVLKEAMVNLEDYTTVGGSIYDNTNTSIKYNYNRNDSTYYVNTELRNGLKQMWPVLVGLFVKAKGNWDTTGRDDFSPIYDPEEGRSALEYLTQKLYDLKLNCGIDFAHYEIEPSLKRMVEYNGFGQPRSSASYKVSYLDHLLFTLIASYDFGFLTRYGSATNEPYQNNEGGNDSDNQPHGHGLPTGGILTVNDTLYSMTSGAKHAYVTAFEMTAVDEWLGVYELSLDPSRNKSQYYTRSGRSVQCNNVFRCSSYSGTTANTLTSSNATNYKFPMGFDFPALALLSGFAAGDAGIPNGGRAGIIPTSDTTTVGDSTNDYRTYYPYVGNGLGELNTGRWVMGWIARACWEGEGPYYYAPANAPTVSISGKTYYIYFRPDGRIYALVYKQNVSDPNTWEYFYPEDGGNDVRDPSNTQLGTYYLRENRYKAIWETDRIMLKAEYADGDSETRYYTINRVVGNTGTDKYLLRKINDPENTKDEDDAGLTSGLTAGSLTFREKIAEKNAIRECQSQEEAMFRNFQWLMLEKKIVFIMPMRSYVHIIPLGGICGEVDLDPLAVAVLEANGIAGMINLKKGSQVGYWNIKGNEGTDVTGCTGKDRNGNTVNYGDSYELGDGRIFVLVREDASYLYIILAGWKGDSVDIGTIWNTILGSGSVTPAILGDNLAPIARMAFLQDQLVPSSSPSIGNESATVWQNRNKLLPIVVSLAGDLHEKSYYKPPASGYWFNFVEADKHRYPLKYLRDLLGAIASPLFQYYKTPYTGATKGWFVPQIKTATFTGYTGNFGFFTPKPVSTAVDFKPKDSVRTVANILTENTTAAADGIIPALANGKVVSKLLAMLQDVGQYGPSANPIYVDSDKTSSDYTQWGSRRKLFYGLEQIITRIKCSQSTELSSGFSYFNISTTGWSYPGWIFTKDASLDVDLDIGLNEFIGTSDTDEIPETGEKGLAVFVDNRPLNNSNPDRNWINFDKMFNGIAELLSTTGTTQGQYCITPDLISLLDKMFTGVELEDEHLKALRHMLGVLLYKYDYSTSTWVVPADLKNLLTDNLPGILASYAGNYNDLLSFVNDMLADDGFLEEFLQDFNTSYTAEELLQQIYDLLGDELITNPNSALWSNLGQILTLLYINLDEAEKGVYQSQSDGSFDRFVYQTPYNGDAGDYIFSPDFNPYQTLGLILSK